MHSEMNYYEVQSGQDYNDEETASGLAGRKVIMSPQANRHHTEHMIICK